MRIRASWAAFVVGLIGIGWARPSHAEGTEKVRVRLQGAEAGLSYAVAPRREQPTQRCADPCEVAAPPGRYELHVYRGNERLGIRGFVLKEPMSLQVTPPDKGASNAGLALGIVGSAAVVGGLIAIGYAALSQICESEHCGGDQRTTLGAGLVALTAGAIMTPIGWVMFARNRSPRLETLRVGFVPGYSSASLSARMAF